MFATSFLKTANKWLLIWWAFWCDFFYRSWWPRIW